MTQKEFNQRNKDYEKYFEIIECKEKYKTVWIFDCIYDKFRRHMYNKYDNNIFFSN
jgi:hypothetical protein